MGGVGRPASLDDEGADEMIERRTQVVDDLAGQDGEAERGQRLAIGYEHVLSSAVLVLSGDSVRFGLGRQESRDLSVQVDDVLVGPLELSADSI